MLFFSNYERHGMWVSISFFSTNDRFFGNLEDI